MGGWSNWRKKALFQVLPQCSYVPSDTAASYEFKYMYYDAILCVGQVVVRWSNGRKKAANFSVLPQLLFWHGIFITIFIWLQFNVLWCYAVCGLKGRKGWQVIKSEEAGFFHVFPQCSDTRASYIFIYENVHIWVQIRCTMICCVWVERKKRMWADNGRNEAISFSAIPQFLFL